MVIYQHLKPTNPRTAQHDFCPNGTTQRRKAHVERMKATGQWDPKTTPVEDPSRKGYRVVPGKTWDAEKERYVDIVD